MWGTKYTTIFSLLSCRHSKELISTDDSFQELRVECLMLQVGCRRAKQSCTNWSPGRLLAFISPSPGVGSVHPQPKPLLIFPFGALGLCWLLLPKRIPLTAIDHQLVLSVISSCSQVTCPGSFHVLCFSKLHCSLESVAQLRELHILSLLVTQSIHHSVTTCTTVNLLPVFQIKTHFSLPYVNTSHMHWLNVFHSKARSPALLAYVWMPPICSPCKPNSAVPFPWKVILHCNKLPKVNVFIIFFSDSHVSPLREIKHCNIWPEQQTLVLVRSIVLTHCRLHITFCLSLACQASTWHMH